jgi:signal transduction histidine kinase
VNYLEHSERGAPKHEIENEDRSTFAPWRMYVLVGTVWLIIIGMAGYSFRQGMRMNAVRGSLLDAAMEIKLEATNAHLWFEKSLGGGRSGDIQLVWAHLDQADRYARAALEGRRSPEGTFVPVDDAETRQEINDLRGKLAEFRDIAKQRLAQRDTSGAGTPVEQRYGALFRALVKQVDKVESRLRQVMARELRSFQYTQIGLVAACLLVSLLSGIYFSRFQRRRREDLLAAQEAKANLEKAVLERERVEKSVRIERDNLVNILGSMDDGVYIANQQHDIEYLNPALRKEFGPFEGKKCYELFHDRKEICPRCRNPSVFSGETVRWEWHSSKSQRTYDVIDTPLKGTSGRVLKLEILRDITERKRAEEELRAYQEQLRSLASELALAEERERRRIAGELHDHIGQSLALSKMRLGLARESTSSAALEKTLDEISTLIDQCLRDTRSLTFDLSPPVLYELGFGRAVEWLAERFKNSYGITITLEDDGQPKAMGDDLRFLLFRAVRELLVNVVKHAHANTTKVTTRRENGRIRITVEDDGVGFEASSATSKGGAARGYGLFSIQERMNHLGGHVDIEGEGA